jgi:hypothetical protein
MNSIPVPEDMSLREASEASEVLSSRVVVPRTELGVVHLASADEMTSAGIPGDVPKWQLVMPCAKLEPLRVITVPPL